MKRFLKISALILLYCLATAKSCSNGQENKTAREQIKVAAARDSLCQAFSSGDLSEELMRTYEESAMQKLLDFSDYMKILNDSSIGHAFRQKAEEMARELFISDSVVFTFSRPFDSVKVIKPLHKINDMMYTGQLSCTTSGFHQKKVPGKGGSSLIQTIDFSVIRSATILGKDTLKTWKVFLCNIH